MAPSTTPTTTHNESNGSSHNEPSAGCPNQCQRFEVLPADQGIMITLHVPSHPSLSSSAAFGDGNCNDHDLDDNNDDANSGAGCDAAATATIESSTNSSSSWCTCLKLHPQTDANLSSIHPNIYIPAPLLEYPQYLKKYGGGGKRERDDNTRYSCSGVTVFGGYHPLLGNLVMKHGGHKDLIELVSLAKIEREMGVRAKFKIDCLMNENGAVGCDNDDSSDDDIMISQTDHLVGRGVFGSGFDQQQGKKKNFTFTAKPFNDIMMSQTEHQFGDNIAVSGSDERRGKKKTRFTFTATTATTAMTAMNTNRNKTMKMKSQPILATMETMIHRMNAIFSSEDNLVANLGEDVVDGSIGEDKFEEVNGETERRELQIQAIQNAMEDMKRRIPAFRMIYISPMHVRERKEELRNRTFRRSSTGCLGDAVSTKLENDGKGSSTDPPLPSNSNDTNSSTSNGKDNQLLRRNSSVMRKGRRIHLFGSAHTKASSINVHTDHVDLCFGGSYQRCKNPDEEDKDATCTQQKPHSCRSRADGSDGYASLIAFVDHLRHNQEHNDWKITLAQQTIGQINHNGQSRSAMTASLLLAQGKLHGPLLHHLIDSEIQVIRNLQLLTMPEELDVTEKVRSEYEEIMSRQKSGNQQVSAAEVSSLSNNFVGKAIRKNFHPITGRFVMLRQFGIDLRHGNIHLKPKEVVPAKHLENLFYKAWERAGIDVDGCIDNDHKNVHGFEDTFNMYYRGNDNGSGHGHHCHPIFDQGLDQWHSLLELSLSIKHPNATNRIWTCGLNDGGLHNMFLSESQHWMFDLGEPNLEPIPAFLTKFLMSFFHTLGMEEDEKGDWIVRFKQDDSGKLQLTEQTLELLPKVMNALNITMDRLIAELFDGEEEVRVVLLRYVVTQLISDAAFCIEKWRIKGGGDESRSGHQDYLEKWLWRALWDVYASEEIRRRYLSRILFRRQMEFRGLS
ncbi:hypothetical protein ACHAXR_011107 [Thalassiosira sp. AJA248-18]